MALGYLALLVVGMSIVAIIGTILLFALKNRAASDVILVLMTVYGLYIAFIGASAEPMNFMFQKVVHWIIGAVAVGGAGIRFGTKQQSVLSKVLVVASVVGGIIYTFFV